MTDRDNRATAGPGELWASADACLLPARSDADFWASVADALGETALLFDRDADLFGCVTQRCPFAVGESQLNKWQAARDEAGGEYRHALCVIQPRSRVDA